MNQETSPQTDAGGAQKRSGKGKYVLLGCGVAAILVFIVLAVGVIALWDSHLGPIIDGFSQGYSGAGPDRGTGE